MHKKYLIALPLVVLATSGCGYQNEAYRSFIKNCNYNKAYINTNKAYFESKSEYKDKDKNLIDIKIERYYLDKTNENNYVFNHFLHQTGKFVKEDLKDLYHEVKMVNDSYYEVKKTNDELTEGNISKEKTLEYITNFFYNSNLQAGKTGGYYYGDEVKQLRDVEDLFKVEDGNLIYDTVNYMDIDKYIAKVNYTLNSLGMLTSRYEHSVSKADQSSLEMTITIKYNKEATYDASTFTKIN